MIEADDPQPTPRDAQRQTLAELIRLATECVSLDATLQTTLDQTLESAKKRLALETSKLAGDVETKIETENASFAESSARIESENAARVRSLTEKSTTQKQRLLGEYDNASSKVKKEFQDAQWLADSVMDSDILHANAEHKSVVEKSETDRVELDNTRADGVKRLQTLGHQALGLIENDIESGNAKSNVPSDDFGSMKQAAVDDVS
ncbi:MAG TPA: hypothetical protein PK402_12125, partial [Tepidisphaeraceae bacterium]|nr:hypothetical protein [Tepidisphaeraceae bacterium]